MESVELQTDRAVIRRTLLAAGLGAALGIQGWRLALALAVPWYGALWIWIGHLFLGISVGMTAGVARWWKRGLGLGLVFGAISAFGALSLGMRLVPYGAAALTVCLASGVLTALIADAVFPAVLRRRKSEKAAVRKTGRRDSPKRANRGLSETGLRLAREARILENLERERVRRRKPGYSRTAEDRIVWSELLELELQDIDERLEKICEQTEDPSKNGQ
jgi:hypothetical protein